MRFRLCMILAVLVCMSIIITTASPTYAVGKYTMSYWRELGQNEAGSRHEIVVWVFDESGKPMQGVEVHATWPALIAVTDATGRATYDLKDTDVLSVKCVDAGGSESDETPQMCSNRNPSYGVYSYECAFIYKADSANPGSFDTTTKCTVNLPLSSETDAPYTRSLAFNAINCQNRSSDAASNGQWTTTYGQTFEATGDRVVAIAASCYSGGANISWNYQILSGGPNGTPVSPVKSTPYYGGGWIVAGFGVNECPVVAGQTYFLKIWREYGMETYHTNISTYGKGDYYENGQVNTGADLKALVCCMTYGSTNLGNISGTVKDTTGAALYRADVFINPGNYAVTTDANGNFLAMNLPAGSYEVVADRPGYCINPMPGIVVNTGQTTAVNITAVKTANNFLNNPSFDSDMAQWNLIGPFGVINNGDFNVPAFSTPKSAGKISSYGADIGTIWQTVTGLTPGTEYRFSSFIYTDSYENDANATRIRDYPVDVECRLGVDINGTSWSAAAKNPWTSSHHRWSFVSMNFTPSSTTATVFARYRMNFANNWNVAAFDNLSVDTCAGQIVPGGSIIEALGKADGAPVVLQGQIATIGAPTLPTGTFYIEDLDRTAAIRVVASELMRRGELADISGKMATNADGERYIDALSGDGYATYKGDAPAIPETITMTGRDVGGTNLNANTLGVYQGKGLYNVGKIVTVFGKITYKDQAVTSAKFFYLDDGSGLYDGNGNAAATGIRIDMGSWTNPTAANALVTGVVTKKKLTNGNEVRVIRPIATSYVTGF